MLNWFRSLRRRIRVYICFLLPLLAIGIAIYFHEYITVTVFSCLTAFITLPLFIYSEEIRKELRDEEFKEFMQDTVISNQKAELAAMRAISAAPISQDEKSTKVSSSPAPESTDVTKITAGAFPIQTTLAGVMLEGRKDNIKNSAVGDPLTIFHSDKADHPNTYYVTDDCTGVTLGLLPLDLGMRLTKLYEKSTRFIGEIVTIQTDNQIVCEIKISNVKE